MSRRLDELRSRMEAAVAAMDFEEAARLRDRLSLLRGRVEEEIANAAEAALDTSRLTRQRPGAMGLGTSDQKFRPPAGWTPPTRPDPMTAKHKRRKGKR